MRNQQSLLYASICEPDLERSDNNVNDLVVISSLQTEDKDGKGDQGPESTNTEMKRIKMQSILASYI